MAFPRRSLIAKVLIVPVGLIAVLVVSWLLFPERTVRLGIDVALLATRLEGKQVQSASGVVHYYEGGEGETIVLLHGIFSRKENWILAADVLSSQYRVIVPDLPGFGENEPLDVGGYRIEAQYRGALEFLNEIKVDAFHVAGSSMGGLIAAQMARASPDRVKSLAFLGSPFGVSAPEESDMDRALASGHSPLVTVDANTYWERFSWLERNPPYLALIAARGFARQEIDAAALNKRIWDEVTSSQFPKTESLVADVEQPTLIVWCSEDRVFHVSGAKVLLSFLPKGHLQVLQGCGHAPLFYPNLTMLRHYAWLLANVRAGIWPPGPIPVAR